MRETRKTRKTRFRRAERERRVVPVEAALRRYLCDLNGNAPSALYNLVLAQVEPPLLRVVLEHAGGNRSRAADMLGINRNTLRKKLQHYGLDGGNGSVR